MKFRLFTSWQSYSLVESSVLEGATQASNGLEVRVQPRGFVCSRSEKEGDPPLIARRETMFRCLHPPRWIATEKQEL